MTTTKLKIDDVVRNKDGALMRVRYADNDRGLADVYLVDAAGDGNLRDSIELPIADLRRVVDPARKLPPIAKLPEDRPTCPNCAAQIRPWVMKTFDQRSRVTSRTFDGWQRYAGLFCSKRCGVEFGAASYRAGYRIKR